MCIDCDHHLKWEYIVQLEKTQWEIPHLCHREPILMMLMLTMIDHMEMDLCDAFPWHKHDPHHYCMK